MEHLYLWEKEADKHNDSELKGYCVFIRTNLSKLAQLAQEGKKAEAEALAEKIQEALAKANKLMEKYESPVMRLVSRVCATAKNGAETLVNIFHSVRAAGVSFVTEQIKKVRSFFSNMKTRAKALLDRITGTAKTIVNKVTSAVSSVIETVGGLWESIKRAIGRLQSKPVAA